MQVFRAAGRQPTPWKNGGGVTWQIAVGHHPRASDWAWRASLAAIDDDGPFSLFEGVDRTLFLVEGEGLQLDIEGRGAVGLHSPGERVAFPGEARVFGRVPAGPVRDFNLMVRRGFYRAAVLQDSDLAAGGGEIFVLALSAVELGVRQGAALQLGAWDAAVFAPEEIVDLATAEVIAVRLSREV